MYRSSYLCDPFDIILTNYHLLRRDTLRKLFHFVFMLAVFCLMTPITGQAEEFRDLPRTYIFYDDVKYLTDKKIISGFPDGTFGASHSVTRAQAAIMIGRALELSGEPKDTKFNDVTAKVTGSGYIASAVEKGIIAGYPDNTFRPYEPVTRGQMAIFLNRAFQLEDNIQTNIFKDISPNMKAYQSILNVNANRIAFGYEDSTYRPDVIVTRGQFSAFLARALEPSFRGTPTFTVESVSGWEKGAPVTKTDIDTEWVITFNDRVDERTLRENIYIVRESDHQLHSVYPSVDETDPRSVKLNSRYLFDFDENYTLYITKDIQSKLGKALTEPITIKFHTNPLESDIKSSFEQDGVHFDVQLDQNDEKVLVKVTAANTSNDSIPYIGFNGCDPGMSAHLYSGTENGPVKVGSKWGISSGFSCTLNVPQYHLEPGESIEVIDVLYLPKQPVENLYVKIKFNKGNASGKSSYNPINISIPLQEE